MSLLTMSPATVTSVPRIEATLSDLFDEIKNRHGKEVVRRAPAANVVVLASSADRLASYDGIVATLSRVHACRLFLVYIDSTLSEFKTSASVICYGSEGLVVDEGEARFCTEIVRIGCPLGDIGRIPSILRAHLKASVPTELVLSGHDIPPDLLDLILPLADRLLYSSETFLKHFASIATLIPRVNQMIDLQWIYLSPWRGMVRSLFDLRPMRSIAREIEGIAITGAVRRGEACSATQLLAAGWLIDRLGLQAQEIKRSQGRIDFVCRSGRLEATDVTLALVRGAVVDGPVTELESIDFAWSAGSGSVKRSQSDNSPRLEAVVDSGAAYRFSEPLESDSVEALIERYFFIGESISNYSNALRVALGLYEQFEPFSLKDD